jgi:hypothetical protein
VTRHATSVISLTNSSSSPITITQIHLYASVDLKFKLTDDIDPVCDAPRVQSSTCGTLAPGGSCAVTFDTGFNPRAAYVDVATSIGTMKIGLSIL